MVDQEGQRYSKKRNRNEHLSRMEKEERRTDPCGGICRHRPAKGPGAELRDAAGARGKASVGRAKGPVTLRAVLVTDRKYRGTCILVVLLNCHTILLVISQLPLFRR